MLTFTLRVTVVAAEAPQGPPLTANFHAMPASHDGTNPFTFELRFSEELGVSYLTLRDSAFTVTNGRVTGARHLNRPSNLRWEITVEPHLGRRHHHRPAGGPGLQRDGRGMHGGGQAALEQPVGNSALSSNSGCRSDEDPFCLGNMGE